MKSFGRSEAQARFQMIYEIGSGEFARVQKVYDRTTRQVIVMKTLHHGLDENAEEQEIELLQSLTHPHIVQCLGGFRIGDELQIAMEYCGNGCLGSHKGRITEQVLLAVIRDIATALEYIHSRNLIHFDVKPQNILINTVGEAKLADFGVSRHADSTIARAQCAKAGTDLYVAPELKNGETATSAADIWGLGMTAFEMAVGIPIGLTDCESFDEWIANYDPVFKSTQKPWSPSFTRMVRRMLISNPTNRITSKEILALPHIAKLSPTWFLTSDMMDPKSDIFWDDN
jgi:serine/threonine protein kinase